MLAKVAALIESFGHDTVCSQALEPGLSYWFPDDDACVAYADVGGGWVVAGGPICAPERRSSVMREFASHAKRAGKRPRFFAIEDKNEEFQSVLIGEQPEWDPKHWSKALASKASLREQFGVRVPRGSWCGTWMVTPCVIKIAH